MQKKTIIITQRQLDEICGGDSTYLDGLNTTPDMPNDYANKITSNGKLDGDYPEPAQTDDISSEMTRNWWGYCRFGGVNSRGLKECSKEEWEKKNLFCEEEEHGNARLKNMTFGAKNGQQGKSYQATKMAASRFERAKKQAQCGGSPEEKAKAQATLNKMKQNWAGIETAVQQYKNAKDMDKGLQGGIMGTPMQSAPKMSGNGKAHTPKNGVITSE